MVNAGPAVYISPSGPNPIMVQVIIDIPHTIMIEPTHFTVHVV